MGTDFANDGNLIMSAANLVQFFPYRGRAAATRWHRSTWASCSVQPGADLRAVKQRLEQRFHGTEIAVYLQAGADRQGDRTSGTAARPSATSSRWARSWASWSA